MCEALGDTVNHRNRGEEIAAWGATAGVRGNASSRAILRREGRTHLSDPVVPGRWRRPLQTQHAIYLHCRWTIAPICLVGGREERRSPAAQRTDAGAGPIGRDAVRRCAAAAARFRCGGGLRFPADQRVRAFGAAQTHLDPAADQVGDHCEDLGGARDGAGGAGAEPESESGDGDLRYRGRGAGVAGAGVRCAGADAEGVPGDEGRAAGGSTVIGGLLGRSVDGLARAA